MNLSPLVLEIKSTLRNLLTEESLSSVSFSIPPKSFLELLIAKSLPDNLKVYQSIFFSYGTQEVFLNFKEAFQQAQDIAKVFQENGWMIEINKIKKGIRYRQI